MSGAARHRGRGRARGQGDTSDATERMTIPAGGFDGPASRGSGSGTSGGRLPSAGSAGRGACPQPTGGFAASAAPQSSNSGSQGPPMPRVDPARDPSRVAKATDALKNVDIPASAYNFDRSPYGETQFKARPGFNDSGKAVQVDVNAFAVTKYPSIKIYQYDVTIGDGAEKPIVQRLVWGARQRLKDTGPEMIWDGNKLAWSSKQMGEIRLMIDMDEAQGRRIDPSKPRDERNSKRLWIKPTKILNLNSLAAYVSGQTSFSTEVFEGINFLDHLLREGPSQNPGLVSLRRSFFSRQAEKMDLGSNVEVFRGVYQSLRLAQGGKMVVNVDVANTTFWKPTAVLVALRETAGVRDVNALAQRMQPESGRTGPKTNVFTRSMQNRFKGNLMNARYQGNKSADREWKFFKFSATTAETEMIEEKVNGKPTGKKMSVAQYFARSKNVTLQYPRLPLIETTKKNVKFPIEFMHLLPNQRYSAKLDENQTANMIRFAVSRPADRLKSIRQGKDLLNWGSDKYLTNYGLQMSAAPIKTNARVLHPPAVMFGGSGKVEPGFTGKWDLRSKKFLKPNMGQLVSWGIGFMPPGRINPDKSALEKFAQDFARHYKSYGGAVGLKPPFMCPLPNDPAQAVEKLYNGTGNEFKTKPQLLIFLLQDKNSFTYNRLKKSADCRYGVVSQCMQLAQVMKGAPQYHGNVLMKVNAKLGGCTTLAKAHGQSGSITGKWSMPPMFIGADVSHASPGSVQASMAAITVSADNHAGRYMAGCETNGTRVEMIMDANWRKVLTPMVKMWVKNIGQTRMPQQVYYIRDGVSEGQFKQVMNEEVVAIKKVLAEVAGGRAFEGKLTVIIASKRHHIRAFPNGDAADRNGNPLPGCLIERDVTTPNEWDFFLYSHTALQGTSRPTHYTVLRDDHNHKPTELQNMIYEHCYQYMRSTTSVSLHPAVYYAHLASNRAIAHIDQAASEGPQGGAGFKQNAPPSSDAPSSEVVPLIPLGGTTGIQYAMWYI